MKHGRFGATIHRLNPNQDLFRFGFRILDENIEVPILVEHACLDQLKLGLVAAAPAVFLDQLRIREF